MATNSQAEAREAITKAFADLPLLPDVEYAIPGAVDTVFLWMRPRAVDNHFVDLGKSGVEKEIDRISKLADELQTAVRDMHRPTFDLLYDLGVRPQEITRLCLTIKSACKSADTSGVPQKPSPQRTAGVPQAIADTLAHYFKLLTGKRASISTSPKDHKAGGRFLQLVEEVFDALALDASAESCARGAVRKKVAQEKLQKSPFEDGLMGD